MNLVKNTVKLPSPENGSRKSEPNSARLQPTDGPANVPGRLVHELVFIADLPWRRR